MTWLVGNPRFSLVVENRFWLVNGAGPIRPWSDFVGCDRVSRGWEQWGVSRTRLSWPMCWVLGAWFNMAKNVVLLCKVPVDKRCVLSWTVCCFRVVCLLGRNANPTTQLAQQPSTLRTNCRPNDGRTKKYRKKVDLHFMHDSRTWRQRTGVKTRSHPPTLLVFFNGIFTPTHFREIMMLKSNYVISNNRCSIKYSPHEIVTPGWLFYNEIFTRGKISCEWIFNPTPADQLPVCPSVCPEWRYSSL